MGALLSLIELDSISLPKYRYDDDSTDRLNRLLSVAILLFFSLIVTSTQYVGEPISCWIPAHFEDDHEDYTNRFLILYTHTRSVAHSLAYIFTALHEMQTRSSDENSVRLSVKRVICNNK